MPQTAYVCTEDKEQEEQPKHKPDDPVCNVLGSKDHPGTGTGLVQKNPFDAIAIDATEAASTKKGDL